MVAIIIFIAFIRLLSKFLSQNKIVESSSLLEIPANRIKESK